MHGGSVKAESEGEGMGATFTVILPLCESKERFTQEYPVEDRGIIESQYLEV
jgi:hypothetical protein